MSRDWTKEELNTASEMMKQSGHMGFEEFCQAIEQKQPVSFDLRERDRKELVKEIREILGEKAEYMRIPTCAYRIGNYTVDKDGTLTWGEDVTDTQKEQRETRRKKYASYCIIWNIRRQNAVNDSLKSIDQMVNAVKQHREVSLNYMKMIEWEKMLIRQGRKEEQANTERERLRAVFAEERANHAEQEIQILKEQLGAERKKIH